MSNAAPALKLGTRGSPLALWQAEHIRAQLETLDPDTNVDVEIVIIKTRGEIIPDRAIPEIGMGVFSRELDEALLAGDIDLAVHSLKDLPSEYHADLAIAAIPERESPYDAFVSADGTKLDDLPEGAKLGSGSPRRKAQILARRPDLEILPLRGNVETRLRKIREQGLAGTFLAHAGLRRLDKEDVITEVLSDEVLVPAVSQGALAVVTRREDPTTRALVDRLDRAECRHVVEAERAFLRQLRGGCQAPAGALATLDGDSMNLGTMNLDTMNLGTMNLGTMNLGTMTLRAVLASPDGSMCLRTELSGPISGREELGTKAALELLDRGGREILEGLEPGEA